MGCLEILGSWPCDWDFIQVSGTSSSEEGRTHQVNSTLNNKMNNQIHLRHVHIRNCKQLNSGLANFFFVIGIPNLASPPPPPVYFPAPALVPTNTLNHGLTLQLTTAWKDSYNVLSPPKRLSRWSCIESGKSGLRCIVRVMSVSVVIVCWVVCQMWGDVVRVCWCSSVIFVVCLRTSM